MPKDFETSLKELNAIVEQMEKGGLSLNDSLKQFEKGISLIRECQSSLKKAEQKIHVYNKNKEDIEGFILSDESD